MPDEVSDTTALETTRQTDARRKQQMKEYADRKNHASQVHLTIGDKVLVQKPRLNKFTSYYDIEPYEVTAIKGPMITATSHHGRQITRNISFKKITGDTPAQTQQEGEDNTEDDDIVVPTL